MPMIVQDFLFVCVVVAYAGLPIPNYFYQAVNVIYIKTILLEALPAWTTAYLSWM